MNQKSSESHLAIAYALCVCFGIIASVTIGVTWGHWKDTLNQCEYNKNCSCILYGRNTAFTFRGNIKRDNFYNQNFNYVNL